MYTTKIGDPNLMHSFENRESSKFGLPGDSWTLGPPPYPAVPPSRLSPPEPPPEPESPVRRPNSKKRVQFKADPELVQIRPITPQSPRPLPRSRSAPSFAELSPCDPRQIEQAMERARVSDFILSLGCRQSVGVTGVEPYYRSRPAGGSNSRWSGHGNPGAGPGNGMGPRPGSGSSSTSLPRFYVASTANSLVRNSPGPAVASAGVPSGSLSTSTSSGHRPCSANYPRLGFYRKLPAPGVTPPSTSSTIPIGNSRRLDVANTSPFITVRRLSSSTPSVASSTIGHSGPAPSGRAPGPLHRGQTSGGGGLSGQSGDARTVTLARLSDIGLGSTA